MEDSSVMDSGITSRKRISFGAEGLDRALNGGIPKGDVILVSGPTG